MTGKRAFLLGLDGLGTRQVGRLGVAGDLPFLAAEMDAARLAPLTMPFPTAEAGWTSAMTGLNPGWHGRYGDGSGDTIPVPTLPDLLTERGDAVACRGVPVEATIVDDDEPPSPDAHLARLEGLVATIDDALRAGLARWRARDAALVVVRLPELESLLALCADYLFFQHPAFDLDRSVAFAEVQRRALRLCDDALGEAVAAAGPGDLVAALSTWARGHRRTELDLRAWLVGAGLFFASAEGIDGARTRAVPAGGFVRVALRGREPTGVVEPGKEAAEAALAVEEGLRALVDPRHGIPVVRRVHRARDLYTGDRFDDAPDLFVEAYPGVGVTDSGAGEPVRPATAVSVRARGTTIGAGAGLLYSSRGVRGGIAPTPLDLHATLAAWLGAPRDRFAEGEALLP
jgi:hypothetical protein